MTSVRLTFDLSGIDWTEAALVFERAPLGTREPDKLRRSFEASPLACFALEGEHIVGMGRALTDFEYQGAIYDLCLLPQYQGLGLGTRIMRALLERMPVETVILYAVPGKEPFYEALGFKQMKTAMGRFVHLKHMQRGGYI